MKKFGIKKLNLRPESRASLLNQFPPQFERVAASHITLEHGELSDEEFTNINEVCVIGYQSTSYLEVLVVSINGSYTRSSDNGILHITLSTASSVVPVCSNEVLTQKLFDPLCRIPIDVTPQTQLFC